MNAPAAASDHQATLDPEHPWLGLFSYTEETRAFFHGRDEEAAELSRRVQHKILTVLFGQSGLGKTSLLRAGLVPRLRREGYCPVYVRIDYAEGSPTPAEQIKRAVFKATEDAGHWTRPGAAIAGESLWEFLHHRGDLLRDADGGPLMPFLIFDQFEEIFTLGQADDAGKQRAQQFLEDLADLVENRAPRALEARMEADDNAAEDFDFARADYRILIALREDYLAHLESIKDSMPSITQNRMRLARMNGEQALDAVTKPGGRLVTPEVAEAIVRFVAGGAELKNAEIEPSLLSLVCRELNIIRQAKGRKEISTDLLAGSRDTILSEFYERAVADQPEGVRRVIEDQLLTESGYRESLAEERVAKALAEAGAAPDALATLVNRRLLRIEERLDMRRVELTHDVLCKVVLESRNLRREREAREQAVRALAVQRAREAEAHRKLKRARLVIDVCIALLVIAAIGASFGFYSLHRAHVAQAQTEAAEAAANASRGRAENLVSFLSGDLYTELKPTGRLTTLGNLLQKSVAYYAALPPDQATPQTRINQAMALARLGSIQLQRGDHAAGMKSLDAATAAFRKLRAGGDHGEAVTYGLALALAGEGWYAINTGVGGTGPIKESAELLRPLATGKSPSRRVLQLFADDLDGVCIDDTAAAAAAVKGMATCDEALTVLKGLGALELKDLTAATSWVDTALTKVYGLTMLSRLSEAQQVAQQALALNQKVLARRPDNLTALQNSVYIAQALSDLAHRQYDVADEQAYVDMAIQGAQEQVRFDPSNLGAWANWAQALDQAATQQMERSEFARALESARAALALANDPRSPKGLGTALSNLWQHLAYDQAIAGDRAGTEQSLQASFRAIAARLAHLPADAPQRRIAEADQAGSRGEMDLFLGDPKEAFAQATTAIGRLEAIKVPASDANATRQLANLLDVDRRTAARAAVQLGRYGEAEKIARARLQHSLAATNGATSDPRVGQSQARYILAQAVAMQGRKAEARKILAPALEHYAAQYQARARGLTFRRDYAYALYVSAISRPATAAGRRERVRDLAQASRLIAGATPEGRKLRYLSYPASLIAAARAGRPR